MSHFKPTFTHKIHFDHLINMVGNNGFGPTSAAQLRSDIVAASEKAHEIECSLVISYCGCYDIIVHPAGTFQLAPSHYACPSYELVTDKE